MIHSNLNFVFKDKSHSREYIEKYTAKTRAILPQNYSEKYLRQNAISQSTSSKLRPPRQPRQKRQPRKPGKPRKHHQIKEADPELLLAKKEQEIKLLRGAVHKLNNRVGVEDLTVEKRRMERMLLSSSDDERGSGNESHSENEVRKAVKNIVSIDLNGEAINSNKENVSSNMQHENTSDMMFSFSNEYTQNVSVF